MKKKVGELYDKPIVIGNKNEVTKNEIHVDELGGGGDSFDDGMRYFLIQKTDNSFSNFMDFIGIVHSIGRESTHITTETPMSLDRVQAFATSNIIKPDMYRSCYEFLNGALFVELDIDLSYTEYFKPITAKEYYSLIN